jgi:choline dehydrogenase-like flavoprotein
MIAGKASLLATLADTLVPRVGSDDADAQRAAFLRRAATDAVPAEALAGIASTRHEPLLAELDAAGFERLDLDGRTALVVELGARGGETRQLLRELKGAVMGLVYALPGPDGRNPNWAALGFRGPISEPPSPERAPKTIGIERLSPPSAVLSADVCVVGSGAGGSVVAAELQKSGRSVVVLERAGYRNESDFRQLELVGAQELYLRGGLFFSETGSIGLLAGATLGGGTVINSMVCLRPPDRIRADWAALGLAGLDTREFDDHLDAVSRRINVNTEATSPNRVNEMMLEALEARGLPGELLPRNASLDDDPRYCGYCNAGCQQGCKQSTLRTYLQDAADAGARFVVGCAIDRVLLRDGRAAGVAGKVRGEDGSEVPLTVEAPVVVVAAGGIESPALLLRSGIGGTAVGKHLRLHPTYFVTGGYDEEVLSWNGQFQASVSFAFAEAIEGSGFLVESVNLSLPFWATSMAFTGGAALKERMLRLRNAATWHAVSHDTGSGEVVLDAAGEPVVRWSLDDPIDRAVAARAHVELARLHRARGAREIFTFHWDDPGWDEGEDFDAYVARLETAECEGIAFSAHQMSSCRLGADPETSVAGPLGEVHDTPGVWMGDASALPSAPGVNPMITIMALARRTAHAIRSAGQGPPV